MSVAQTTHDNNTRIKLDTKTVAKPCVDLTPSVGQIDQRTVLAGFFYFYLSV